MATGDHYDGRNLHWQIREGDDGVFIRYSEVEIDSNNKGRGVTSTIVSAEERNGTFRFITKSGSVYYFDEEKIAYPMQLLALKLRFGIKD